MLLTSLLAVFSVSARPVPGGTKSVLPFYYPRSEIVFNPQVSSQSRLIKRSPPSPLGAEEIDFAKSEILKQLNLPTSQRPSLNLTSNDLEVRASHRDSASVLHVYARQLVNEIPVVNRNTAIHIKDKQTLYFTSSFTDAIKNPSAPDTTQSLSLDECVAIAEKEFGAQRDDIPEKQVYVQLSDGSLSFAYQFQLKSQGQLLQIAVFEVNEG